MSKKSNSLIFFKLTAGQNIGENEGQNEMNTYYAGTLILFYKQRFISNDFLTSFFWQKK